MAENETTLKLKADISDLKRNFQQAQRVIRSANAEFQAATVGMDNWSESADGLQAKVNQLTNVLGAEEAKLQNLQEQYDKTARLMGENSAGAQELLIRLNKQKVAVANVSAELQKWQTSLDNVGKENTDIVSIISRQEKELAGLKDEYTKIVLEQGKNSTAAKKLKTEITALSGELSGNKTALSAARKEADKLDKSLDDSGNAAEQAAEEFSTFKVALGNLIADGIKAAVSSLHDMVTELSAAEGAYNNFQAQTGKAAAEMADFKDEINEIYKNNLGESLNDVADAMAKVAQNTKETDPSKIKELTENALVLRDTFGWDINETMRTVNMLMEQFGITGDEAFNLITQGAQNGLDKNGDLLDSINEYSVHYKQMGYDADDFFNSLANGTEAGTFSVDKLGDAMKEFGIRTKDTAESTTEGFELLGLNAEQMRKEFAKGGDTAQKATKKTLKALFEMDDEVKQNQAGVALFGTMWEDLGKEGVKALMDVDGELSSAKKSMEEIKQIKYDDVMNDISAIGRQFQMDVVLPIIEKAMPKIRSGLEWVADNLDSLVPIIGTVGAALVGAFVVNKIATFAQSVSTLITMFKGLTTATQAQTAAQTALNATNPLGWVVLGVTAVAGLAAGIMELDKANKKAYQDMVDSFAKLTPAEKALREETNKLVEAHKQWVETKQADITAASNEFSYYSQLHEELQQLVDENGKIKKGYEERAGVITSVLADALGIEIEIVDGQIQKYNELKSSIENVIATKKAEAMLTALEDEYTQAIINKDAALKNYLENQKAYNAAIEERRAAEAELQRLQEIGAIGWAEENGLVLEASHTKQAYNKVLEEAKAKVWGLSDKQQEQEEKTREAESAYKDYITTIENYEGVTAAIVTGDVTKINDSLTKLEKGFISARTGTIEELELQTAGYKKELDNLKQAIKDKTPGVTQEQVDQMAELVKKSEAELAKLAPKAEKQGEKAGEGFGDGVSGEKENVKKDAEKVAEKAEEGLETADAESTGEDLINGFSKGMENKEESLWTKAWNLGKSALGAIKDAIDSNSPSKEAMKIGGFFTDGLGIGIENGAGEIATTVGNLADTMLGELSSEAIYDKLIDTVEDAYDDRYDTIEKAFDNELKAFKKKQDEEIKLFDKATDAELAKYKNIHDNKLALYEEEYLAKIKLVDEETYAKIKAIDDEIAGINETTELEEKALKEEEQRKKKAELQEQIRKAETNEERKAAEEALAEYERELAREKLLEERELRISALNAEKKKIEENAETEREAIQAVYDEKVEKETAKYESKVAQLEEERETEKAALEETQDIALDNLKERHDKYLDNVKEQLAAELEALKLQKEAALDLIDEVAAAKQAAEEEQPEPIDDNADNKGTSPNVTADNGTVEAVAEEAQEVGKDTILSAIQNIAKSVLGAINSEIDWGNEELTKIQNEVGKLSTGSFRTVATAGDTTNNVTNITNFYQTNNSPKALSRTEIYRQTSNQLAFAGGVK